MHKTTTRAGSTLLLIMLTLPCIATGQPSGLDRRPGPATPPGQNTVNASAAVPVSSAEARQLAVSHGLTGRRALPPGISRNLARGKPLPPGIAKQLVPGRMLMELPDLSGYEWRIAGRDLILVALGTLVVAEILENVFE